MQDVLYHLLWFATNIISRCSIAGSTNPNSYYYAHTDFAIHALVLVYDIWVVGYNRKRLVKAL